MSTAVAAFSIARQFNSAKSAEGWLEVDQPRPARWAQDRDRAMLQSQPTNLTNRRKKKLPETVKDIPCHYHPLSFRLHLCQRPQGIHLFRKSPANSTLSVDEGRPQDTHGFPHFSPRVARSLCNCRETWHNSPVFWLDWLSSRDNHRFFRVFLTLTTASQ
jgi:hypothetical protein